MKRSVAECNEESVGVLTRAL